ncbi:MAG: BrnT family toxin [Synergistaceae bacterium]|nr:BrnT family toxin [Synergistaceae bacterium]
MQFEWDENKRQINIEKHGIDFADAVKIFEGFITSK